MGPGTEDFLDMMDFMDTPGANKSGREYQQNREEESYQHTCKVTGKELEVAIQEEIEATLIYEFVGVKRTKVQGLQ